MSTIINILIFAVALFGLYILFKLIKRRKQRKLDLGPKSAQSIYIYILAFSPTKIPDDIDTIVIGSGMAGLTCAASLSKIGHKVVILEKHQKVGGCLHTYTHKGYEFDSGLHFLGDMFKGRLEHDLLNEILDQPVYLLLIIV